MRESGLAVALALSANACIRASELTEVAPKEPAPVTGCAPISDSSLVSGPTQPPSRELVRRVGGTPGELRGRVLALSDAGDVLGPMAGAQVRLAGTGFGAMTRDDGTFAVLQLPVDFGTVEIRRIGYETWSAPLALPVAQGVYVEVALAPLRPRPHVIADERMCPLIDRRRRAPQGDAP